MASYASGLYFACMMRSTPLPLASPISSLSTW
jgi:hypothetical protein